MAITLGILVLIFFLSIMIIGILCAVAGICVVWKFILSILKEEV